ncbi:Protein LONGIFOLIA 1 [Raphanus sativus]|uniref:Protein LONGIFOLIA 1 n=1 Tax=Raphanus sativus TaxID=3726 RepID=A0A6J0KD97_RAPSA|nr:protein LONGIFOLIA 1 [Raphanus sativus]KAJ4882753.1 Protein LONGIFOLIA 1 [Raphanus sativus]
MSAKLLYNLSDENPNLNKQFGCMNGIFQVFYRQHYPARRVSVGGDELKSLPSGKTSDNVGVTNVSTDNKETEKSKKKKKAAKEKHSSESSSRLSFSSSPCSSSFSSADISTTTSQFEQPGLVQTSNGETPAREQTTNGSSPRWGGLMMSSDLRELVRSSIHKETRARDEQEVLSQQPKSARANVSLLKEPSPWSEGRRVVKLKDSPRFSYDERETRKTGAKFKETPRLSLDSRSNSFKSAKSSCSPEPQDHLVAGHRRTTSSVIAKLMGLDVIPDEPVTDQSRENHFCDSPRPPSRVEAARSSDSVKKMMPAKFPMKTAPWTQVDGARNQVKAADAAATLTVYGEIQKRLSQLEFKKSEKDLRALQQILEAMEKTQQLMSKDDDNSSLSSTSFMQPSPSPKSIRSSSIVVMKAASAPVFKETGNSSSTTSSPLRSVALPNVKVSNLRQNQKVTPRKQSAMDVTPRPGFYKGQTDSATRNTSTRSLQSKIEMAKSGKGQKPSVSPRTQPKKLGFEKQSRPTSPKPEPNKIQRQQLSRQQTTESSSSPRRKPGMKSRGMQQSEDRLSDESSDLRSLRSDSNLSSASILDIEVTSRYKCDLTEQHTPKQRSPELGMRPLPKPLKITVEQPSPVSILDVAFDDDESPSPVRKISIVFKDDDHIRSEESLWVNKHNNLCRSIVWPESNTSLNQPDAELTESLMEEGAELRNGDHKYISEILFASGLLKDIDYNMLSIQLHQAHLPINPSLFFVLEQNKKGSATHDNKHRGRGFGQQQAANLIERSRRKLVFDTVNEILARKFAAEGCTKQPYITSSISSLMTTDKSSRGKELLESLCSEIDRLQDNSNCILDEDDEDLIWEDLQSQGMNWKEIEGETPGLVLDIERLIFKDLISEVVTSEVAAFPGMLSGQPRQLFHC